MGGSLLRANDGVERPLRDWTLLRLTGTTRLGVVCPDVYAADVCPDKARFTLLRSAVMTQHDPNRGMTPGATFMDQG